MIAVMVVHFLLQVTKRFPPTRKIKPHSTACVKKKTAALDERPKQCYNQSIAAGFYRLLALLISSTMILLIMVGFFLLQVFQRLTKHECDDADAGYRKQKVRHGFHLPSV